MNLPYRFTQILTVLVLLIASCSPQATQLPTVVDVENEVRVLPTATSKPIETAIISSEITTIPSVNNTDTPTPAPTDVLSLIGTPLPKNPEPIDINTYTRLERIGQWGRGSIQGVGFTPDGKSFIAISEMGWSIYNMDALDQPPQWTAFDKPALFDEFYFSSDGTLIKFYSSTWNSSTTVIRSFPSAEIQQLENGAVWLKPNVIQDSDIKSPNGSMIFKSYVYTNPENITEEKSIREMYNGNNQLLYSLSDYVPPVTYSDRNGPEGCDLSVFSPCGNALMPLATTPVKTLFSADNRTFTALYAPTGLYLGLMKAFSYIRIYDSATGNLLGSLGGFTKPVQDFDYSPGGKLLVVGFVDGSIVLWDIAKSQSVYGSRHMNAPAWRIEYSHDSKYLLIQRADELEVRLTTNGALVYRFGMAEFAVSPVRNWVALGSDTGNIQIRDLDSGAEVMNIKAHDDRIYSIAFSPDGLYLATSGRDCDIKLWDLGSGKLLHYFEETAVDAYEIGDVSRIFSTYLEFVPGKNMLIGFGSWGTVVNWNVNSGATNYVIQSSALEYYNGMITLKPHFPEFFDTDTVNDRFYINENGFNLITGESLGAYTAPTNLPEGCSAVGPQSVDQKLLFTLGYDSHEGEVCILNAETMELLGSLRAPWANWLYLSPDGKQLIVMVGSGSVYVYQIVQ